MAPRAIVWERLRSWAGSVAKHYRPEQLSAFGVNDVFGEVTGLLQRLALVSQLSNVLHSAFCHNSGDDVLFGHLSKGRLVIEDWTQASCHQRIFCS